MLGQNMLGFPDTGILLVSHAGNGEMFQQSRFFRYVDAYFGRDYRPAEFPLPEDPDAHRRLTALTGSLRRHFPKSVEGWRDRLRGDGGPIAVEDLCASLDGRSYRVDPADGCTVGLLPFIVQVVQNHYTRGLTGFRFSYREQVLHLELSEADATYRLPIGFDAPAAADLSFHGEPYRVAVTGRFTRDEDEVPVLIVRLSFLEIANARILRFHFHADRVVVRFTESPGRDFLIGALAAIRSKTKEYSFVDNLVARADGDFIRYKVGRLIEPEVEALPDALGRSFWRG
jgi:hypothetical protein